MQSRATKNIDKLKVKSLIESTEMSDVEIASAFGCSRARIQQIAAEFGLNSKERRIRSISRARREGRSGRPKSAERASDVVCPKCKGIYILKCGTSPKYGVQKYICGECRRRFQTEYPWVTSGDQARHLSQICHASGYKRPDTVERFERIRAQRNALWPYKRDYDDDAALLKIVNETIPRNIPEDIRADVCQDVILAVLEGRIRADNLKTNVRYFLPSLRKRYAWTGERSLDAPLKQDSKTTLGEMVSELAIPRRRSCPNCRKRVAPGYTFCSDSCEIKYENRTAIDPFSLVPHVTQFPSQKGRPRIVIDLQSVKGMLISLPLYRTAELLGIGRNTLHRHLYIFNQDTRPAKPFITKPNPYCVVHRIRMRKRDAGGYECSKCIQENPRPRGRPSREIDNQVVSCLLQTQTVIDVADSLGVHRNLIYHRIRKGLITGRPFRTWTPHKDRSISL